MGWEEGGEEVPRDGGAGSLSAASRRGAAGAQRAGAGRWRSRLGEPDCSAFRARPGGGFGLTASRDESSLRPCDGGDTWGRAQAGATGRREGGSRARPRAHHADLVALPQHDTARRRPSRRRGTARPADTRTQPCASRGAGCRPLTREPRFDLSGGRDPRAGAAFAGKNSGVSGLEFSFHACPAGSWSKTSAASVSRLPTRPPPPRALHPSPPPPRQLRGGWPGPWGRLRTGSLSRELPASPVPPGARPWAAAEPHRARRRLWYARRGPRAGRVERAGPRKRRVAGGAGGADPQGEDARGLRDAPWGMSPERMRRGTGTPPPGQGGGRASCWKGPGPGPLGGLAGEAGGRLRPRVHNFGEWVAEGGPPREPLPLLEVSPRKRLPAGPEQDPCGSRPTPEGAGAGAEQGHSAGGGWCRHCHTKLAELKRQAWKLVSGPGTPLRDPRLSALLLDTLPAPGALSEGRPEAELRRCTACAASLGRGSPEDPNGAHSLTSARAAPGRGEPEHRRGPAWPPGPSVQVSVVPAGPGGALSTVTIQAQQCPEGTWSVSRVDGFLPPSCLAEAAVAAVAVADTVRDVPPVLGAGSVSRGFPGPSAAASFFIRAAQKFSLASKRKKGPAPPAPAARGPSAYPTDFSGALHLWPPPAPPCLLRAASKAKDIPCGAGKVRVMLRVWPAQGPPRPAEATSFLKVEPHKKQVTLYDTGPRRAATTPVPRMFAFDAVFPQDAEQAEVCAGTVTDVLQAVVSGADGCIFSFGHTSLGKSHTMIGEDSSPRGLGVVPCAISWLFKLISGQRERTGTRFSVRVSAVEVCGREQGLRDLLAEVASGSLQDTQSPGLCLQEDPVCGTQLQNQSELRAPTAEKAAFYLDAALAARSSSQPGCGADSRHSSHLLFTLHVYQYRMEKCGQGGMSGGRSRLHLIDLGSCGAPGRAGEAPGGPLCLSLPALGSILLALVSGSKHVPYRDHRLTILLREALATPSCRATMIAHISDAPAHHAETLGTMQLAARLQRLRRKRIKYASSSSGGESSCEEGRARRPPPLRPLSPRLRGDPDRSSSSEQSCDTVIYVGPGGAVLSDRDLTDNEGPPDFVPIVPALSRRRPSQGPCGTDRDHFRCSTFAELQERLECMDGDEGSPGCGSRKPNATPGPDASCAGVEPKTVGTQGGPREAGASGPEPPAPDKAAGAEGRRPLPSPAPPPPRQPEAPGPVGPKSGVRSTPMGMNGQVGWTPPLPDAAHSHPVARGRCLERSLLTATVTLQQPVELNGEDELVFTVVEELALGSLPGTGRPSSLASFGSDCSLQALASGSRPVSIISSINDEFDAYTAQAPAGSPETCCPDLPAVAEPPGPTALEGGSFGFSELPRVGSPCLAQDLCSLGSAPAAPARLGREPKAKSPRGATVAQTIHSSLPRKSRTALAGGRMGCPPRGLCSPGPEGLFEDPWTLRTDVGAGLRAASPGGVPIPPSGWPWLPTAHEALACVPRVVDGCEGAARAARQPEAAAPIPLLRRGATTLGVSSATVPCPDAPTPAGSLKGLVSPGSRRSPASRGGLLLRPGGVAPPAPPVRKSSLEPKGNPSLAPSPAVGLSRAGVAAALRGDDEARPSSQAVPRATASCKGRAGRAEVAPRPAGHASLERNEGVVHTGGRVREAVGRPGRAVPRLGVPPTSPTPVPTPASRSSPAKATGIPKPPAAGSKGRSLGAGGARALSASVKSLAPQAAVGRTPGGPAPGPRATPRTAPGVGAKAGRGTVMGTKQALRAAHCRVHELAASGVPGRGPGSSAAAGGPALPSPYSTVTAPRRPQRRSSGHGSDTSSVLSGELPPAMGRTALFYHSGGSSGYESMIRDSEATGSASSAPDSTSDSGAASPGARARSLRGPKRRATGLQRRRLIPAPLPDVAALGRKPVVPAQWVDLPPLAGPRKEPFEIKVYEIDDVARLQRHRPPPPDSPAEPGQDAEKGAGCVGARLRLGDRRQQRLREVRAQHQRLCEELAATQGRLMLQPGRWRGQFEVDPALEPGSAEHLAALERVTAALEQCVNLCKAHVMMVTCFDISAAAPAASPGPQEVDV
ncbi:kinesin-like protein KIF26A [Tamandua tetradactyla]|uniref:kinesin-like protein KIF26A n=1 Tax=Tamandua tetradactyla TaxID=48850 RepID=UPI004053D26E